MDELPIYNARENLDRVLIDENSKYLIVEGPFDLSIYSILTEIVCQKRSIENNRLVVFGGGKSNILKFIDDNSIKNSTVILDMDFDGPDVVYSQGFIYSLRKYSIENYAINVRVLSRLLSVLLGITPQDIRQHFTMEEFVQHLNEELRGVIPVLYYYQCLFNGNKERWSSVFLNRGNGDWRICRQQIERFKTSLLSDMQITEEECAEAYRAVFHSDLCVSISFPGKILLESLHRFLKEKCSSLKADAYSTINSKKTLFNSIVSDLSECAELESLLLSAVA